MHIFDSIDCVNTPILIYSHMNSPQYTSHRHSPQHSRDSPLTRKAQRDTSHLLISLESYAQQIADLEMTCKLLEFDIAQLGAIVLKPTELKQMLTAVQRANTAIDSANNLLAGHYPMINMYITDQLAADLAASTLYAELETTYAKKRDKLASLNAKRMDTELRIEIRK